MNLRNRRRLQAGLIVAVFVLPVAVMLALTLTGWVPRGRSYGERIQPERDLAGVPVQMANGETYAFDNHDAVWTLVDRKSTRLNSSHPSTSYAVFCLKKKNQCIHIP